MHMAEQKHLSNPALRGRLLVDEPMRKHLTWRTGGAADHAYVPADLDDAAQFLRSLSATEPIYFIGLGSNVLVRDGGIRGTVMLMHSSHAAVHMDGALVYAEARAASPKVARYAATHGYVGAEFLAGVPGTVGGALAMNAGCYGSETWEFVKNVITVDHHGQLRERDSRDYEIGYRHIVLRQSQGPSSESRNEEWFLSARFHFPDGDREVAKTRIKDWLTRRIAAQ